MRRSPPELFSDVLLQRLERGLALLLDVDLDAVAVEPVLHVGELVVGLADQVRDVLLKAADLGR